MNRLDEIIRHVGDARPLLVDKWEATALIESFGYTDARVRRELGFPDALALGTHVFHALAGRPASSTPAAAHEDRAIAGALASAGATLVYALPCLALLATWMVRPSLLRVPQAAVLPLGVALLLSLVVSGGFVQAVARVGRFYLAVGQPRVASLICARLLRIAIAVTVLVAVAAAYASWLLRLYPGAYLVLGADAFIALTVFWIACAIVTLREQYWRVMLAWLAGALAFAAARIGGIDALSASLVAAAATVVTVLVQVRAAFGELPSATVPLPNGGVIAYRVLPYFCYGLLYFLFLGLHASTWLFRPLAGARAGLAAALIAFLVAACAVEYANARFGPQLQQRLAAPARGETPTWASMWRGAQFRLLAGYGPILIVAAALSLRVTSGGQTAFLSGLLLGSVGYVVFAAAALNALILFTLNAPWPAVTAIGGGVLAQLVVRAVVSAGGPAPGAADLTAGAAFAAAWSALAVRERLRHAPHAVATF